MTRQSRGRAAERDPLQDAIVRDPEEMLELAVQPAAVLRLEAEALSNAAERLDAEAYDRALELLAQCSGKVLTLGAGTSGIIARKIAATLTSTGSPAMFLHPSDALHGGLGAVSSDDVVIAVSNSGETEEVLAILPYLRSRGVQVLAIVGNLDSRLGREADAALDAAAPREACPLDLAPTCSTTLAMAIGDALAVTLIHRKGFTAEAFALNHPSGRLGRRLTLRVRNLMHPSRDASGMVSPSATWLQVVQEITKAGLGAVTVVDEGGRLVGLVTDGDLRRTVARVPESHFGELCAADFMTKQPVTVGPDALAYEALQIMEDRPSQIAVLPVVDESGRCVGLLRLHDLVRAGL